MGEREEGGIPLQRKHKYSCGMSSDWCTKRRKERPQKLYWGVPGPSLSDLQKMQNEIRSQKLILNPARFNMWQESKQRIFFPTWALVLAVRPRLGFCGLWNVFTPCVTISPSHPGWPQPLSPSKLQHREDEMAEVKDLTPNSLEENSCSPQDASCEREEAGWTLGFVFARLSLWRGQIWDSVARQMPELLG